MKQSPFLKGLQLVAVLGGGSILLGCLDSSTPARAQNDQTDRKETVAAETTTTQPQPQTSTATNSPNETTTEKAETVQEPTVPENFSPGIAEVAKLAQSGVSEEVLLAYVERPNSEFNPSVDEILYLNDLGVSDKVVTAILNRSKSPDTKKQVAQTQTQPAAVPAPQSQPATPAPENVATPPLTAPQQPVTVDYFYDALSPYGTWIEVDGYGRCWQPTVVVVDRHWRPYCDRGRWIYSDCGWYWHSEYSWGWAPFHYGRWHCSPRVGWVWVPDCTWGPSWVSWRYSDDYCGWAPLPPSACYRSGVGFTYRDSNVSISFDFGLAPDCYTFVPVHRFCDPHPYRHCLRERDVRVVYNRTTVNNYYFVNNNVVVNQGITPERIIAVTHTPIKQVAIKDTPVRAATKLELLDKNANTLFVHRPVVAPGASFVQPKGSPLPSPAVSSVKTGGKANASSALAPKPVIGKADLITPKAPAGQTGQPLKTGSVRRGLGKKADPTPPTVTGTKPIYNFTSPTATTPTVPATPAPASSPVGAAGKVGLLNGHGNQAVAPVVTPKPSGTWVQPRNDSPTPALTNPKTVQYPTRSSEPHPIVSKPIAIEPRISKYEPPSTPNYSSVPQVYTPPLAPGLKNPSSVYTPPSNPANNPVYTPSQPATEAPRPTVDKRSLLAERETHSQPSVPAYSKLPAYSAPRIETPAPRAVAPAPVFTPPAAVATPPAFKAPPSYAPPVVHAPAPAVHAPPAAHHPAVTTGAAGKTISGGRADDGTPAKWKK